MQENALLVAGVIFLLVSILHLVRLIKRFEVKMGNFVVPFWISIFGFTVSLFLSLWMFVASR